MIKRLAAKLGTRLHTECKQYTETINFYFLGKRKKSSHFRSYLQTAILRQNDWVCCRILRAFLIDAIPINAIAKGQRIGLLWLYAPLRYTDEKKICFENTYTFWGEGKTRPWRVFTCFSERPIQTAISIERARRKLSIDMAVVLVDLSWNLMKTHPKF